MDKSRIWEWILIVTMESTGPRKEVVAQILVLRTIVELILSLSQRLELSEISLFRTKIR